MERTPSPPRRVRTPPAPRPGPKYDGYEPFSPRRSTRVAAQHSNQEQPTSSSRARNSRDVTPTSTGRKSSSRAAHPTLSPPSSPSSPAKLRSPRSTRRTQHIETLESDSDAPSSSRRLFASTMASQGMLPTPAKTPRKRALHSEDSLRPTARVLFANRPLTVEDAMPTPRKAQKAMRSALESDSFEEQMSSVSPKIGVYVDSKERVPDRTDDENNPFLTRRSKRKAKAPVTPKKPRKMDEETAKMYEAAARNEGMVYTHRGRTIFRQYDDVPATSDVVRSCNDEAHLKVDRAGQHKRLTRSSLQPKLLFKEEIEKLERARADDDDEEAPTDIELPTPSKAAKRQSSFDSWTRVKSASRSSSVVRAGTKRGAEASDDGPAKRARSEPSFSSSPSSLEWN